MRWEQAEISRIGEFESQVLDLGELVCGRHLVADGGDYRRKAAHLAAQ